MIIKELKKYSRRKIIVAVLSILVIVGAVLIYKMYDKVYGPNVDLGKEETTHLHIPTGSSMEDVISILDTSNILISKTEFRWLADKKNYSSNIHPGRYLIKNRMSNNELINMLRSGRQDPVDLIFNNIRRKKELAEIVSRQIEANSNNILHLLNDKNYLEQFGFTPNTVYAMIIPNTYEMWWNTSAREFIRRMNREYKRFWHEERKQKARKIDMNPVEVVTLASIVDEETIRDDEMPKIAGVYINRLEKGMRLQADPTIKYAIGDFTVNRVLDKHLKINSPYNTYKNAGLPPGPISFPSIAAVESVLNYKEHDYLYFVARPDFSGYHNFSETHYKHIRNAKKYQSALNKRKIME
jgi:UPF0755 protein